VPGKKPMTVIGLMSGTSVDSVDAACIRCELTDKPLALKHLDVLEIHTTEIPADLRMLLLDAMGSSAISLETLCRLNMDMGTLFGQAACELIQKLAPQDIQVDLIASHGQTLYHLPPVAGKLGATLQIGEPAVIAEMTGVKVAADFRPGDMAAGGQGAPLVPFADMLLFQHKTKARAVQNIGGIANLTALAPAGGEIIAFDTGPGNMVMDGFMQALLDKPFDADGKTAASGHVHHPMLVEMRDNAYFLQPPPKSTGREHFGRAYAQSLLDHWASNVSPADMVTTATHLTAITIMEAYQHFVLPKIPIKEMIVGGGGAYNRYLMQLLKESFSTLGITVKRHEDFGIPSKYKEAIAFALLGLARKFGIPGNIPSCTGATHPVVLGGLWEPVSR